MKYSKTTVKELTSRYRAVLRKCLMINAILMGVMLSMPAVAADKIIDSDYTISGTESYEAFTNNNILTIEDAGDLTTNTFENNDTTTVESGGSLNINANGLLTNSASFSNFGTVNLGSGASISNSDTIKNSGTIEGNILDGKVIFAADGAKVTGEISNAEI